MTILSHKEWTESFRQTMRCPPDLLRFVRTMYSQVMVVRQPDGEWHLGRRSPTIKLPEGGDVTWVPIVGQLEGRDPETGAGLVDVIAWIKLPALVEAGLA